MKDQPGTNNDLSPWRALGVFAVAMLIVLAFIAGVVTLIKWT
jgi:hypothetical protein